MFKVGITGGIGSGKSTVARVFEILGIPVYYADAEAKKLLEEDPVIRKGLMNEFGDKAFEGGVLNRKYIAAEVFNNEEKLLALNQLVHPRTIEAANEWALRQKAPYTLKEAALIFESRSQSQLDFVIGVYAPEHIRIQRTMERDGISREEVKNRMNKQIQEEIKMKLCNAVIINNGQEMILPQVLELHKKLLQLATEHNKP